MVTFNFLCISQKIGNHEAGGWSQPRYHVGLYLRYFPHQLGLQGLDPQQRPLYHYHKLANHTAIVVLDSGIVEPINGIQLEWLKDALQKASQAGFKNRLAYYHLAMYPAVTFRHQQMSEALQSAWAPVFEKYGLTVAFEHHYHVYKRSHPMKDGLVSILKILLTSLLGKSRWSVVHGVCFLVIDLVLTFWIVMVDGVSILQVLIHKSLNGLQRWTFLQKGKIVRS